MTCHHWDFNNYLQEAVRDDKDLNHLRHREMLRLSDGKDEMGLGRYIKALTDLAILTDQSNPRKNASDGRWPRKANLLKIEPDYNDDQSSEDEDDSIGKTAMFCLIHRALSKNTKGHISPERWERLTVETRRTLHSMTPEDCQQLYESLSDEPSSPGGSHEANTTETTAPDNKDSVNTTLETVITDGD